MVDKNNKISKENFINALMKQNWRGPDNFGIKYYSDGQLKLGHNRLTILDSSSEANMPMENADFSIIYNGEIYNHMYLRDKYKLNCKTHSDTETILEGYSLIGEPFLYELRGMFSFVIVNKITREWIAIRDHFGIKPLYFYDSDDMSIFASETISIRSLVPERISISEDSILEWKSFRRPMPGQTFFNEIQEVLPGYIITSDGRNELILDFKKTLIEVIDDSYSDDNFEILLKDSVRIHQMNDYKTVSLLSGGLDSAIMLGLSDVLDSYTVGLNDNNEFEGAEDSASVLNRNLTKLEITSIDLKNAWKELITIRGEPLSLPNEGLIYLICKKMRIDEKVLLTGEGADELLFGYDKIFTWAEKSAEFNLIEFVQHYCYNYVGITDRFKNYLIELAANKSSLDFLEDFFIHFHLPGLLRRMDFASMAASKEARVPFVDVILFNYMYRKPFNVRFKNDKSKFPLHLIAEKLKLFGAMKRKKIGFSATIGKSNRASEYTEFQNFCLNALKW